MTSRRFSKKQFNRRKIIKKRTGFTLIEMLFAVAIFISVVAIALTLFVYAIRGQRRNLAYQGLLDQTSYAMEYMSRSVRMAMKDDIEIRGYPVPLAPGCIPDAPLPYESKLNYWFDDVNHCLIFRNYKDECQYFCLTGTQLVAATTTPATGPPASYIDLTSPELEVYPLGGAGTPWINLDGEGQNDSLQPLVEISLSITGREDVTVEIQTSISQRNLDVLK